MILLALFLLCFKTIFSIFLIEFPDTVTRDVPLAMHGLGHDMNKN